MGKLLAKIGQDTAVLSESDKVLIMEIPQNKNTGLSQGTELDLELDI